MLMFCEGREQLPLSVMHIPRTPRMYAYVLTTITEGSQLTTDFLRLLSDLLKIQRITENGYNQNCRAELLLCVPLC